MINHKECCGCSACVNICPKDAISMGRDAAGFYKPNIDESKCILCGLCDGVCGRVNGVKTEFVKFDCAFAGYLRESGELLKSASGGCAYSIMRYFIEMGSVVYGVQYGDEYKNCYYSKATARNEIEKFRGSKYIQSQKEYIFRDIKRELNFGKRVLFIGLPCDVIGLKAYLNKPYEELFTVDLICYGCTTPMVAEHYIDYMERKFKSKVKEFTVKDKSTGWENTSVHIKFESGKTFTRIFRNTEYGVIFNKLSNEACTTCKFKGVNRCSDLTVGDYWGIRTEDSIYNRNGVSLMFPHTEKAKILMGELTCMVLEEVESESSRRMNVSIDKSQIPGERNIFEDKFIKDGLKAAHDWKFYARLVFKNK